MFEEIMDTLSTTFTIFILIVIVIIVAVIIKGISDYDKQIEIEQQKKEEKAKLLNTVISQSRQFPTEVLISQRDEVYRAYTVLESCKRSGTMKIQEMVWIRVGDKMGCWMDIGTCCAVIKHLDQEIERRR